MYKLLIVLSFSFLTKAFRTIKFPNIVAKLKWNFRLHRCWWQMFKTKCAGDSFNMLVPFDGENCFHISVGHQHSKDVTKIEIMSPTSKNCRQHHCYFPGHRKMVFWQCEMSAWTSQFKKNWIWFWFNWVLKKNSICFQYKLYGLVLNIYFYLTKFILYATLYFKLYILYFKVNSAVLRRKKYESYCMTHNKWYCLKGFCISGNKDVSNIWVTVITGTWPWFKSSVRIEHSASNYICFDIWS